MTQWRRRNRNTFARINHLRGRRYADMLPQAVNDALDAVVAYHEEQMKYYKGGSSEYRCSRRETALTQAIAAITDVGR